MYDVWTHALCTRRCRSACVLDATSVSCHPRTISISCIVRCMVSTSSNSMRGVPSCSVHRQRALSVIEVQSEGGASAPMYCTRTIRCFDRPSEATGMQTRRVADGLIETRICIAHPSSSTLYVYIANREQPQASGNCGVWEHGVPALCAEPPRRACRRWACHS